jgi:hypothetical protein
MHLSCRLMVSAAILLDAEAVPVGPLARCKSRGNMLSPFGSDYALDLERILPRKDAVLLPTANLERLPCLLGLKTTR